jgi:hypothetical protein
MAELRLFLNANAAKRETAQEESEGGYGQQQAPDVDSDNDFSQPSRPACRYSRWNSAAGAERGWL